ncbi:MAG TPA: 50S ribosomal protein L27 [Candidatus Omnitrophota bacterium]|nr:50S ribosomal protein L27 [Candidatus Omnitrophota bacterium]HPD84504.1 50S ribosomal protein L27 [Candidatus Omnitrophota bacterium]HRZ03362.1 50S ribosomal protein L27 [Candidatus Omnitrophota bacterium]
MTRLGGLTHKHYKETHGIKVAGGQHVKSGTILTREGDRWKPGLNVLGRILLTAACDGEVYFTRKMGKYKRSITLVNIRPEAQKAKK